MIPAGHTAIYQPLDTHINGVVAGKLTAWHTEQISKQEVVTLADRKDAATRIFRSLKPTTIRRAFIESLFIPAMQHVPPPQLTGEFVHFFTGDNLT